LPIPAVWRTSKVLELRVPEIEGFVIAGPMMGGAERFGLGPGFERVAVLLHRVGRIKRVILSFGAFRQLELDEHSEKNLDTRTSVCSGSRR
jgi:hypothetical protein